MLKVSGKDTISFFVDSDIFHTFYNASIVDFEQVNVYWEDISFVNVHYAKPKVRRYLI